jgi:predicted glycoside hydrolase/deacetylase ChbG (UPF0249 family)
MSVIVNADDMGVSDDVNRSIILLHRKGIVSSTSLMANGQSFKGAVDLLSLHPELGTGVHLCLDGPFQSSIDYKSIIDRERGSFYDKEEVVRRIRKSSFDRDEIYSEFCLQVEKVMDHGIEVSHLDTHHNLHLYFPVLSQVIRVARKYGISYVRSQRLDTCIPKNLINKLYRNIHQVYLKMRLNTVQGYYDPAMQDCIDFEHNLARLEQLLNSSRGIIEIMLHPVGENDPETSFFSSPEVVRLFSSYNILNYHQLR